MYTGRPFVNALSFVKQYVDKYWKICRLCSGTGGIGNARCPECEGNRILSKRGKNSYYSKDQLYNASPISFKFTKAVDGAIKTSPIRELVIRILLLEDFSAYKRKKL